MTARLNPYLSFSGNAREALEFYKSVFGGELTLMTFEQGGMVQDPSTADQIMHGQLEVSPEFILMGADMGPEPDAASGPSITLTLNGDDESAIRGYWGKLTEGGSVQEELAEAPWGDIFGMCTDRYGYHWMFDIAPKSAG